MPGPPQTILGEVYAAPPAIANGPAVPAVNARAELIVVAGGPAGAIVVVGALADVDIPGVALASRVVSVVAITLAAFTGRNVSGAVRFYMVFDLVALPADGATPARAPIRVEADQTFSFGGPNSRFTTGYTWASSSTDITLTVAGADFLADTYTFA